MGLEEYTITDDILPGDIGELIAIQSRSYFGEYGYGLEFEAYISKLFSDFIYRNDGDESLWKVLKEGRIIGSVALFREERDQARMRLLFIQPEERGKGLGTTLVNLAVDFARDHGYSSIVLMTEDILTSAGRIYERAGFKVVEAEMTNIWGVECQVQTYRKYLQTMKHN